MNILVQGVGLFRLLERNEMHEFPAGTVQLLDDRSEKVAEPVSRGADGFASLVERVTDQRPTTAHSRPTFSRAWRRASTSAWTRRRSTGEAAPSKRG